MNDLQMFKFYQKQFEDFKKKADAQRIVYQATKEQFDAEKLAKETREAAETLEANLATFKTESATRITDKAPL